MILKDRLQNKTLNDILLDYPFAGSFFKSNALDISKAGNQTWMEYFELVDEEEREDRALDPDRLLDQLTEFINQKLEFLD